LPVISDDNPVCRKCGGLLLISPDRPAGEAAYCPACKIAQAEKAIPDKTGIAPLRTREAARLWAIGRWLVLLLCIAAIAIQAPGIMAALQPKQPLRSGPNTTDRLTDGCIANLWKIAGMFQDHRYPGTEIVCPATKKPYTVISAGGNTIVRCPSPEAHGVKEIAASLKCPRPELKK
jgi:hypothetical protein